LTPTDVSTRPIGSRSRAPLVALIVIAIVAAAGFIRVASSAMATPDAVDHVTVANGTAYGLDVVVRGSEGDPVLRLGRALPQTDMVRHEVLDAGDRWILTFTRGGTEAGRMELSHADLERDDWRITVPGAIEEKLAAEGQQPYPEEGKR
jgi:hypothetical protein